MGEHYVQPELPVEPIWLLVIRYTGYTLSVICLIIFIVTIALSKSLKEQFHVMRMHMAIAMLFGIITMVLSDFDFLRDDILCCIVMGTLMHVFFTACAGWLALESWAAFKAVTHGIITGKLSAYVSIAYGIPLVSLGVAFILGSDSYGSDARCMISVNPHVKWMFFGPLIVLSSIGFLLSSIVACNLNTPAMRMENIVKELGPVCQGLTFIVFYFTVTWGFGIPAYFDFNFQVSFYPLFQVLHCFMGVLVFLFLGLYSPRFRFVIKGQASARSQWLLVYAMGHSVDRETMEKDAPSAALLKEPKLEVSEPPTPEKKTPERVKKVFVA